MPRKAASPDGRAKTADGETESKSARTRIRILDSAAHVLSIKGYAGMRLSDVADHAELQAPAIYYYFPSREDLIEEVMWAGIADMRDHLAEVLSAAPADATPMDKILLGVEAHLRHELDISDYTTASIRNAGQLPEKIRKRQVAEEARYGEVWRKLFKEASAAGQIRADLDLYIAQMLVFGALNWTAEWWNPKRGSLETVVAMAQSFVREGLAPSTKPAAQPARKK
ncbi:MAG TPA: TetR/AcrR family transcriptional regulator [Marmoricola sp.]|nr:TetR/AcrR family transcriptional regulator [Marmoricola sp.]